MISSTSNPRIKAFYKLKEPHERRKQGLCIIEGRDEISLAFNTGVYIQTIIFSSSRGGGTGGAKDRALMDELRTHPHGAGIEFIDVSFNVLSHLAYRCHPDSLLAVAHCPKPSLADFEHKLMQGAGHSIILLEGVEKPGNIGAALRSIDAAGLGGLLACSCWTDLANPNVICASKGSVFTLPVAECTSEAALSWVLEREYRIFALSPGIGEKYYNFGFFEAFNAITPGAPIRKAPNAAFVFGSEHDGLSPLWLEYAHVRLTIPMQGKVNSLNIAQAVTLVSYEIMRQKEFYTT